MFMVGPSPQTLFTDLLTMARQAEGISIFSETGLPLSDEQHESESFEFASRSQTGGCPMPARGCLTPARG